MVWNPLGPHHCAACFGSVHTLKTSSRGASKTRVRTRSGAFLFAGLLAPASGAAMVFLLFLDPSQVIVQSIEALRPEPPVALDPSCHVFERARVELAGPPLRFAPASDQPRAFQHFQMLRH